MAATRARTVPRGSRVRKIVCAQGANRTVKTSVAGQAMDVMVCAMLSAPRATGVKTRVVWAAKMINIVALFVLIVARNKPISAAWMVPAPVSNMKTVPKASDVSAFRTARLRHLSRAAKRLVPREIKKTVVTVTQVYPHVMQMVFGENVWVSPIVLKEKLKSAATAAAKHATPPASGERAPARVPARLVLPGIAAIAAGKRATPPASGESAPGRVYAVLGNSKRAAKFLTLRLVNVMRWALSFA